MKKFICLILCGLLLAAPAMASSTKLASIFLEDLSFEDLKTLDFWLSMEMAKRPEWKNVTVPPGAYEIGVDIPSRWWDITLKDKEYGFATINYGKYLDRSSTQIEYSTLIYDGMLDDGQPTISIYLEDDNYIVIEHESVVFTPHVQPSLGF